MVYSVAPCYSVLRVIPVVPSTQAAKPMSYLRECDSLRVQRGGAHGPSPVGRIAHEAVESSPDRTKDLGGRSVWWLLQREVFLL